MTRLRGERARDPARKVRLPAWLGALRWPLYRRVWLVAALQQFGYWFSSIAFQWLVARRTGSDPLALSLLYFCMLLPMLLLSLPAGVLADTRDRRRVVLCAQLAILVISSTTATLVVLDRSPVWSLMACGFAVGTAHSVAQPASQALVANAVPVADLRSAVVLQAIGMNLARTAGPALAGLLILSWGAVESLLTYGGIGLFAIIALRGVPAIRAGGVPATRTSAVPAVPRLTLAGRIAAGLRHARARPPAAFALAIVAVTSLFAIGYLAQLPAVAALVSPRPSMFLVLTCVGGLGSLAGVLAVAARPATVPSVTPAALMLAALGGAVVGLGAVRLLWAQVVLIALAGGLQFGIMTHCNSVIQRVVDDDHRGRVMSLYVLCWGGLLPVGGLLLGTVWHLAGPLIALCANGCVAVAFAGWVLRPGAVRAVADQQPPVLELEGA